MSTHLACFFISFSLSFCVLLPCSLHCASVQRTLTMCMRTGEEEEELQEEETEADRNFIDDDAVDTQAHFRDIEELPRQFFRQVGVDMEEAEEEDKQKKKERQEPRTLLPSTERATYADVADEPGCENYMFMLPCIATNPLPYHCLLQSNAVAAEKNEYLLPKHIEYLQGPCMRQHARLFGKSTSNCGN